MSDPRLNSNHGGLGDDLGDTLANSLMDIIDQSEEPTDVRPGSRDRQSWIDDIGPEEADPEVIMDELETYGFDQADDGLYISNPTMPSDMPETWHDASDDADRNFAISALGDDDRYPRLTDYEDRPVEDEATGNLEDDEDLDEDAL